MLLFLFVVCLFLVYFICIRCTEWVFLPMKKSNISPVDNMWKWSGRVKSDISKWHKLMSYYRPIFTSSTYYFRIQNQEKRQCVSYLLLSFIDTSTRIVKWFIRGFDWSHNPQYTGKFIPSSKVHSCQSASSRFHLRLWDHTPWQHIPHHHMDCRNPWCKTKKYTLYHISSISRGSNPWEHIFLHMK